jgi:alcohol dehydrogenase class IV
MQEEYIFPGAINRIEEILDKFSLKNIFLVRGNQSFIKSGAQHSLKSIYENYKISEFTGFSVNPKLEEAIVGNDLFKNTESNLIIAVGGGSVIDTAKIIKYLAIQENANNANVPLIAIPTTAGTGSEATHFAVVYINGVKHSWADKALVPTLAIVDANLLKGQSKYQMAVSGIDAFAQGIESVWSVNSTEESRQYSENAIKLIWENLKNAIEGDNLALEKTAEGSNWSGKAINIAKTTAPHALSYHITKKFNIPHGHAVALFLPFFVTYNFYLNSKDTTCISTQKNKYPLNRLMEILKIKDESLIEKKIKDFIANVGICTGFKKLTISKEELMLTLESANPERLKNNPREFDIETFLDETSILSF